MSKLFRHIFLKQENTTQKRENNLNDICDMAKVRDLRDFYKTVMKKNNGKSDDKVPPFASAIVRKKYWKNYTRKIRNHK